MRIVFITAGSGDNSYCENCLRDLDLARGLRDAGQDVVIVPLYLPVELPWDDLRGTPVFFGGINVLLQQKSWLFRHTPRWLDWLLDRHSLLRWVSRWAGMTTARQLGQTTVSMLQGPAGRQAKELQRLLGWLTTQEGRPDVVCLSNALLLGLARPIRDTLGVPVACLLQDEDAFLDLLPGHYAGQAWALVKAHAEAVDGFVAVSQYYAQYMRDRLGLAEHKVCVIPMGILPDAYAPAQGPCTIPTIGYLSRLCYVHGLDLLVEGFIQLHASGLDDLRLRISGGHEPADRTFIRDLMRRIERAGLSDRVAILEDFGPDGRRVFMSGLTVLAVPERRPVAAARYALEALAGGVPVVAPDSGVFAELARDTGAVMLYQGSSVQALAEALEGLVTDPPMAYRLGCKGRQQIMARYSMEVTAGRLAGLLHQLRA